MPFDVVSFHDTKAGPDDPFVQGKAYESDGRRQAAQGFSRDAVAAAERRLQYISDAVLLEDLASPPGNRLEALKGDRTGQHSIRINDRWRICFRWTDAGVEDVEIVDYH